MKALTALMMIFAQLAPAYAGVSSVAFPEERLTLGGIAIGQSEASVTALLGNPKKRTEESDFFLPITLSYPGLVVSLDEQGVGGVHSSSEKFCTLANVCPGMTYAQVTEAYGHADPYERDGRVFRDYLWDDGCWLRISFQANVATTVETTCSP